MKNIILLHGAIGAASQFEPLKALLKEKYNVFTFNFSGHDKTPFQTNFGIEQFALELESFIAGHKLVQPAIFGYSMGGYVALSLAHIKPDLLGSIITLGTKWEWSPEIAQKEIQMLDAKTIAEKVPKYADVLMTRHGNDWEKVLQKTADMMLKLGDGNLLDEAAFSTIQQKVLIGLADKDTMVTLNETTKVFKQLKTADMFMLPASKHPLEMINTPLLAAIIENFLK
ncbi:MAG: alpha/beta fold hydrolase [Bacteroidota bacterium]